MKLAKTYRLSEAALNNLERLKTLTGVGETALVEMALAFLVKSFGLPPGERGVLPEAIQANGKPEHGSDAPDEDTVNAMLAANDGDRAYLAHETVLDSPSKGRKRHKPKHGRK